MLMPPFMLAIAFLMVSNVPYPSFKEIDWHTSARFRTFIVLILGLGTAFIFRELFFALLFCTYIAYGPARYFYRRYRAHKHLRKAV